MGRPRKNDLKATEAETKGEVAPIVKKSPISQPDDSKTWLVSSLASDIFLEYGKRGQLPNEGAIKEIVRMSRLLAEEVYNG